MAKEKKTPEELSRIRSLAAQKRKTHKGGRPKGWTKDPALKSVPIMSIPAREPDRAIFRKLAFAKNMAIAQLVHIVAESLKAKNPDVFPPEKK